MPLIRALGSYIARQVLAQKEYYYELETKNLSRLQQRI